MAVSDYIARGVGRYLGNKARNMRESVSDDGGAFIRNAIRDATISETGNQRLTRAMARESVPETTRTVTDTYTPRSATRTVHVRNKRSSSR